MRKEACSSNELITRPQTKAAAITLIHETYRYNDWDSDSQARFESMLGLEPKPINERTVDELRVIVARFEASKMILFRKEI